MGNSAFDGAKGERGTGDKGVVFAKRTPQANLSVVAGRIISKEGY